MPDLLMRVVDVETTGLTLPEAEVIEIGTCDLWFDPETKATRIERPLSFLFSATRPIPPEASAVHHLISADLRGLLPVTSDDFDSAAHSDQPYALVAHNWAMEGQWFTSEVVGDVKVICTLKAAYRAWEDAPGFSNQVLRYWRGLELDARYSWPPHRAGPDAYATAHLLAELLKTETVSDLVRWTKEPRYYATMPIGKHKGLPWSEVPHSYLTWIVAQQDMEFDIKAAANAELNRRQEQGASR